jgi:non-ribosomal peptide synthetase-like protein
MPGWFVDLGRYVGALLVFGLAATFSALALVPCVGFFELIDGRYGRLAAICSVPFLYGVWGWGVCLCIILYKRLIFYTAREGEFSLFSPPVIQWGTVGYLAVFINGVFLKHWKGSPFLNWYLRLMGAKIGKRVSINTTEVYDWDLITIDDDAILGGNAVVIGHLLESGKIKLRPVHIGKKCLIGTNTTIMPGTVLEDLAVIGASSTLTKGARVNTNSIWAGTPARFIRTRGAEDKQDDGVAPHPAPKSEAASSGVLS